MRAFHAICIGVDAFLTIRLMDGNCSFTGASVESLKNDPAHRPAHIPAGVYRRSDALIYTGCVEVRSTYANAATRVHIRNRGFARYN